MSLFRFFFKKPPDGLFQLCDRVYVFDRCFTTEAWDEDEYKIYIRNMVAQLRDQLADASFLAFDFRDGAQSESQAAEAMSEAGVTVMDYPRQFEGCPLLKMELVHHFLRSSESWLSLGHQNVLLMHCQRGAWPVLAFMLAALLVYNKQCNGEMRTLEAIHKQAPHEILQLLCPLNPVPSQVRYLQYVSRRNVVDSEWPPADRKLLLDCVILRFVPSFFGERDARPVFRIYGHDYSCVGGDRAPKVLYSSPKRNKFVRANKMAEREVVKIDINCHVIGDVVVECLSLNDDVEREEMMFRFMFNTAFIRSNILMLNRDEVDVLWDSRDRFPKEFRAEILFSEMDATACAITRSASCFEEKDGVPEEAFAQVQELFSQVDLNMLQHLSESKIKNPLNVDTRKKGGKLRSSDSPTSTPRIHSSLTDFTNTKPLRNENATTENVAAASSPEPELLKPESITISRSPKSVPPPTPPPPPLQPPPLHFSSPAPKNNASGHMEKTPSKSPPPPPPPPPPPLAPHHFSSPVLEKNVSAYMGKTPSALPPPPPPPPPSRPGQTAHAKTLSPIPPPLPPPPLLPPHKVGSKSAFPMAPPPPPPAPAFSSKESDISSSAATKGVPKAPGLTSSSSGKGLLSRTISSKSNCKKLKPLHWMKITRATQGSLWAEAQKYGSIAPEIDMSELESLFSAALSMSSHGRKSIKRGKSEKLQLIEHRRAYNCEIMLSKVKIPLDVLMNSVLLLEDSALDVDQVENLVKFCPTQEEMELLKGYTGEKENLGKCEQFFLELMKVPRVESKLRVFSFKLQFRTQVSDLRRSLNIVNSASEEIRNSTKLKRIMQTILSLGNALNQGTSRGSAVGFKLDSILKLIETRARNNKTTLMHYLCKVLAEKLPEVIDFSKDLSNLESASKIQLKSLAEEMQAVSKGLEKVIQELSNADNDGPIAEDFCKILKEFLLYAEAEVRSLTSLYSSVGRNMDMLILYFGEDLSRCTFEQVVSTLLGFTRMFNKAHDENCKQLEREAKKLADTEKLKIAVSHKLSNEPLHSAV